MSSFGELASAVDTPAAVVSEDEVTEEHITEKTKSTTTYYLPEKLNEDLPVIMEKEDYSIEMSLSDDSAQMLDVLNKEVYLMYIQIMDRLR